MRIRVKGIVNHLINLDEDESEAYKQAAYEHKLHYFMEPYLDDVVVEFIYGPEDEFDGSSV